MYATAKPLRISSELHRVAPAQTARPDGVEFESLSPRESIPLLIHCFTSKSFLLFFRESDGKSFIFFESRRVRKLNLTGTGQLLDSRPSAQVLHVFHVWTVP